MADFIALSAIVIVALWPLLRRFYIDRFWVHGRGTVIRLEVSIDNSEAAGAWVWAPIIEYHAAGQRFTSAVSYWQRHNPKPEYFVGDKVEILYNPRNPSRFILDSWMEYIVLTGISAFLSSPRFMSGDLRGGSRRISPNCRTYCGSRNQISGIDSSARRARC